MLNEIESRFHRISVARFLTGNVAFLVLFSVVDLFFAPSTNQPIQDYNQQAYLSDGIMILLLCIVTYITYKPMMQHE